MTSVICCRFSSSAIPGEVLKIFKTEGELWMFYEIRLLSVFIATKESRIVRFSWFRRDVIGLCRFQQSEALNFLQIFQDSSIYLHNS